MSYTNIQRAKVHMYINWFVIQYNAWKIELLKFSIVFWLLDLMRQSRWYIFTEGDKL